MAKAGEDAFETRQLSSYVDTGFERSIRITLSATPDTITTVSIDNQFTGFKLYPRNYDVRFAVNKTVASQAISSSTTIATTDLNDGGIAKADLWEVRSFLSTFNRTLTLASDEASVVIDLELF